MRHTAAFQVPSLAFGVLATPVGSGLVPSTCLALLGATRFRRAYVAAIAPASIAASADGEELAAPWKQARRQTMALRHSGTSSRVHGLMERKNANRWKLGTCSGVAPGVFRFTRFSVLVHNRLRPLSSTCSKYRYRRGVVVVTSPVEPRGWLKLFEDAVVGERIVGRMLHPSQRVVFKGGSYRERLSKKPGWASRSEVKLGPNRAAFLNPISLVRHIDSRVGPGTT